MIKFVSSWRQVCGFLRVPRFPPPIKLTTTISLKYCVKHHTPPCIVVFVGASYVCASLFRKPISSYGTASQSSTYHSTYHWFGDPLAADLAITGGPTHDFDSESCATTNALPLLPTCRKSLTHIIT